MKYYIFYQSEDGLELMNYYYDKKQVKTIWTQDSNVDNNLVTIQINDGKVQKKVSLSRTIPSCE